MTSLRTTRRNPIKEKYTVRLENLNLSIVFLIHVMVGGGGDAQGLEQGEKTQKGSKCSMFPRKIRNAQGLDQGVKTQSG